MSETERLRDGAEPPPSSHPPSGPPPSSSPLPSSDEVDASHVDLSTVASLVARPLYGTRAEQLDIGSYISQKRVKLRHQFQQQTQAPSPMNLDAHLVGLVPQPSSTPLPSSASPGPGPPPASPSPSLLFSGLVFWVNGLTSPPYAQLVSLIYLHSGSVENVLVPLVTHCVADRVPTTKVREWKEKSRRKRWIVQARWVVDCVRERRRLPENDFLPAELREKGVVSVRDQWAQKDSRAAPVVEEEKPLAPQPPATTAKESSPRPPLPPATPPSYALPSSPFSRRPPTLPAAPPPPAAPAVNTSTAPAPVRLTPASATAGLPPSSAPVAPPAPAPGPAAVSAASASPAASAPAAVSHPAPASPTSRASVAAAPTAPLPVTALPSSASLAPAPLSFRSLSSRASTPSLLPPPPPLPNYVSLPLARGPPPRVLPQPAALPTSSSVAVSPLPSTAPSHPSAASALWPSVPFNALPKANASPASAALSADSPAARVSPSAPAAAVPSATTPAVASALPGSPPPAGGASSAGSPASPPHSVLLPAHMTGGSAALAAGRLSGRSTLNDPHFVKTFFAASRLHFIGSWKRLFQGLVPSLLSIPPRVAASDYTGASAASPSYILHCDLDCFFASIALRDNPALKDKPVAVCHARGVAGGTAGDESSFDSLVSSTSSISSCNYLARSFGLHAEMSIRRARLLCPALVLVPYDFEKYAAASEAIYRLFFSVTHRVQPVSLDECYLELPHHWKHPEVEALARDLRRRVEAATGVQVSVGIGRSLLTARLATKVAKPNNFHSLASSSPTALQTYMAGLPVSEIPGIGWHGQHRLSTEAAVTTCGQLQALSRERLQALFGPKLGVTLYESCRGIDHRPLVAVTGVDGHSTQRSIAVNINYGVRFEREDHVRAFMQDLSAELLDRLASTQLTAHLLALKLMVRHPDAPIEPPRKFLGHGECDTRNKSRPIEGRGLGEGGATEAEKERLAGLVLELWDRLKAEFKVPVEDLRGVGLQLTRLKPRMTAARSGPFSAWRLPPHAAEAKGEQEVRPSCEDAVGGQGEERSWLNDAVEVEGENEWKEDGMEEEMELDDIDDAAMAPITRPHPPLSAAASSPPGLPEVVPTLRCCDSAERRGSLCRTTRPASHDRRAWHGHTSGRHAFGPCRVLRCRSGGRGSDPFFHCFRCAAKRCLPSHSRSAGLGHSAAVDGAAAPLADHLPAAAAGGHSARPAPISPHPAAPTAGTSTGASTSSHCRRSRSNLCSCPLLPAAGAASTSPSNSAAGAAPTLDAVVADVAATKERAFLEALSPFTSLDRSVISALPFDLRQELASAYKREAGHGEGRGRGSAAAVAAASSCVFSPSERAERSHSIAASAECSCLWREFPMRWTPPSSQRCPPDIREEVERDLRRQQRVVAQSSSRKPTPAKQSRAGKKAAKKKPIERPPPPAASHPRGPLPGVSIVRGHFSAADERKSPVGPTAAVEEIVVGSAPKRPSLWPSTASRVPGSRRGGGRRTLRSGPGEEVRRRASAAVASLFPHSSIGRSAEQERAPSKAIADRNVAAAPSSLPHSRPSSTSGQQQAPPSVSAEEAAAVLSSASSTFLSFSQLEPHFSQWLRSLRRCAPHAHPAPASADRCCSGHPLTQRCACSPHCFCACSPPHLSLHRLPLLPAGDEERPSAPRRC